MSEQQVCFFVTEIGRPGSPARRRSDQVLKYVVRPVCTDLGLDVIRADEISEPGLISGRIIQMLVESDLVIADLSGANPNVFYELGIRHTLGKPLVQLLQETEYLPFDVQDYNTIFFNHQDLDSVETCKEELRKHIGAALIRRVETPVSAYLRGSGFRQESTDMLTEFRELSDRVARELSALKTERLRALRNALDHSRDGSKLDSPPLAGRWSSNIGSVFLAQEGHQVLGKYIYLDEGEAIVSGLEVNLLFQKWTGEIYGQIIDGSIVLRWNWLNGSFHGVGFWNILSDQELSGAWYYAGEAAPYESLIEEPQSILSRSVPVGREWNLLKNERNSGETDSEEAGV